MLPIDSENRMKESLLSVCVDLERQKAITYRVIEDKDFHVPVNESHKINVLALNLLF